MTEHRVLPDLQAEAKATLEAMVQELTRLREENSRLKASKERALCVKLSSKGAISVYGMGRFPVTLYKSQWERLLKAEIIADIQALFPQAKDKPDVD